MQSPAAPYVTPAPPPPAFQPPDLAPAMFPLQQLHPPSAPAIAACVTLILMRPSSLDPPSCSCTLLNIDKGPY